LSHSLFVAQKAEILAIFRYVYKCVMSCGGARKFYSSWLTLADEWECDRPFWPT
jgi:hypothetical protein